MTDENFEVTGMSCSACTANVTRAVKKLDGIESVEVNLLTGSMKTTFDESKVTSEEIVNAVKSAGYGASIAKKENRLDEEDEFTLKWKKIKENQKNDLKIMKNRLIISFIILLPLLYIAMAPMIGLPTFWFFEGTENAITLVLTELIMTTIIIITNHKFFVSGFKALIKRSPNMDTLVAIGSGSAFVYSLVVTFMIGYNLGHGNTEIVHTLVHSIYFESSATILTLVTLGKFFETRSKMKTSNSLEKLVNLSPKTATVERKGKEYVVKTKEIVLGDIIVIRSGDVLPVDGEIVEGYGLLNQASITGESSPVKKVVGENVLSATVCVNGSFKFKATKIGKDTTLSQIVKLVDDASSSKAPISKIADKVSGVFVPIVIALAFITFLIWIIAKGDVGYALSNAISVLVISCPCALGLATPVAIMVGTGRSSNFGILFKSAEKMEILHKATTIVLDKTGTITQGKPEMTDFEVFSDDINENEIKNILFSLESKSKHPIGYAICESVKEQAKRYDVQDFEEIAGKGVSGKIKGKKYFIGNYEFVKEISQNRKNDEKLLKNRLKLLNLQGKTAVLCFDENDVKCIVAVADVVRESSTLAINKMKALGLKVVMLTGDNEETANVIASKVEIDEVIANVLPTDKDKKIQDLQNENEIVVMVGDGINDSPALTRADIGIAISSGTDIAIDSADVVLVNNSLEGVVNAILLSHSVMNNIKMNLFWAFFYNVLAIPIAMGALIPALNFSLSPMIASFAMSFSSVCVCLNALRLRGFDPNKKTQKLLKKFKKSSKNIENKGKIEIYNQKLKIKKEENNMKAILKVGGMVCAHCQKRVEDAILKIKGVSEVSIDLESGNVNVTMTKKLKEADFKKVIEDAGYSFLGSKIEY